MGTSKSLVNLAGILLLGAICACGGGSSTSTPTPTATPPPTANAANFELAEDSSLTNTLSGSAGDGGSLSYSVNSQPLNGSLTLDGNSFEYIPQADYFGDDSFTFTVKEGNLTSNVATIELTVSPVNDAPIASASTGAADEDVELVGSLDVTDIDTETLTYSITSDVANGSLNINVDGSFNYMPNENFNGEDAFSYVASDGEFETTETQVSISINPVNDAPVVASSQFEVVSGASLEVDGSGTDVEEQMLSYSVETAFIKATLSNDPSLSGVFEINVPYGTYGEDTLEYIANDGELDSSTAYIDLTITAPQTQATASDYVYDAGGAVNPEAIITNDANQTIVYGSVIGAVGSQTVNNAGQKFFSIHNADNSLLKTVHFGDSQFSNSAIGINNNLIYAVDTSGLTASFVSLDQNFDVNTESVTEIPFAIEREHKNLTPVHVPGVGFYIIGNDNQLSWIDYNGSVRSTKAIDNQMGYEINQWKIHDVREINDIIYISGSLYDCVDTPSVCFTGSSESSFLLKVDKTGTPISISALNRLFSEDSAILSDGRVACQQSSVLRILEEQGRRDWDKSVADGNTGYVYVGENDEVFWWNVDFSTGDSLAGRYASDGTQLWETAQSSGQIGRVWQSDMVVDQYGNMYVNFIDRYNDESGANGEFVTMHFDFSGVYQWTNRSEPSDMNPSDGIGIANTVLTGDKRIVSISTDNINASGSDTDGYINFVKVTDAPE